MGRPITSDKSDPNYRPWNDPAFPSLKEADASDGERTIDSLTAALTAIVADPGHVHLNDETWFLVQEALAIVKGAK